MMSFKAWIILGCVISVIEFSVENGNVRNDPHTNMSNNRELRRDKLVSAFKKGEFNAVKKLIEEGVLEDYNPGIYDKEQKVSLTKVKLKVDVLYTLLHLKLVSVANNTYVSKYRSNNGLFNVTLIPGSDLLVTLFVNMPRLKDRSLVEEGKSPLHIICSLPDVEPEVVKIFLDHGTVEIDTWDDLNHITPLIIASSRGNLDLVKFLLDNGADINKFVPNSVKEIRQDHQYDYMKVFTKKSVVLSGDNIPVTAVAAAAYKNHPAVLKYLLNNGGDVNNKGHSWLVLLKPFYEGHKEVSDILLKSGINVNNKGPLGATTLHRVAETGNIEMAKLLLKHGADPNLTNNFGWTPLHVAALFGGNTTKEIVQLLLDSGCDANALTDGFFSPLNLVEAGCDFSFIDYLLKNSDSVQFGNHKNLVQPKKCEGHTEALELLVNRGADLDNQDDIFGWTALHWAAANGDLKGAKLLVGEYGASTILKSKMGLTPFGTAKHFGRESVSDYLKIGMNLAE